MRQIFLFLLAACTLAARAATGTLAYSAEGAVWVKDLPNGAPRKIAQGEAAYLQWSASGRWLCYWDEKGDVVSVVDAQGNAAMRDVAPAFGAKWSPLADVLAYSTKEGGLFLRDMATGTSRQLVPPEQAESIDNIAWRPDGQVLAYTAEWGERFTKHGRTGFSPIHDFLMRINADGTNQRELVDAGRNTYRPIVDKWSADGLFVLMLYDDGYSASVMKWGAPLFAVPAAGGAMRKIADHVFDTLTVWPPSERGPDLILRVDAGHINDPGNYGVYTARVPSRARRLTPASVNVQDIALLPDARTLALSITRMPPSSYSSMQAARYLTHEREVSTPINTWHPRRLRSSQFCWTGGSDNFSNTTSPGTEALWTPPKLPAMGLEANGTALFPLRATVEAVEGHAGRLRRLLGRGSRARQKEKS